MPALSKHPGLDGVLRLNRLDGAGLYYGRRGRLGPVDAARLEAFLLAWHEHDRRLRMGVIPVMASGAFDDGRPRTVDALLGDRMVDFGVDEDFVIPGTPRRLLGELVAGKQAAMKPRDRAALGACAADHGVGLGELLDGPWTALLVRAPTFALGRRTPTHVELLAGLGMRPRDASGLPLPDGMTPWKSHEYVVVARTLAEVRAPALTAEVELDELHAGLAGAQADIDACARGPAWQRMMASAGWTEADLEVKLYVRMT
ncbi:hypothetical protein [Nannocystis punicea]|uniref:Uncharacterized protein n=1 Tax=Nannocystis punicea TaxID=2995304 RepID=A0ABY7HJ14_9BACT|nr:hypothetical protein [Nannocystis poenicansa]WAS99312.1 hypothetical protein O0S08_24555 [Nannocystis poenicansa]